MTMLFRNLAVLTGVATFLASAQTASASDVIPLKGTASYNKAQTTTLGSVGDADTDLVRYGYGGYRGGYGGYRGGYGHGGYGGYRGGYGHGHYGGYRGGYYGGYRGGYYGGYGGYRGGYYGGYGVYARPYYGGYGYGGYGGYGYYCGTNLNCATPYYSGYPSVAVLSQQYSYTQPYLSNGPAPVINNFAYNGNGYDGNGGNGYNGGGYNGNGNGYNGYNGNGGLPVAPPSDGTYPYNGGPNMPVPMPVQQQQQFSPAKTVPATPSTLRLVSTPSQQPQQSTTYAYPAYGEDTRASGYTINRTTPVQKTKR